MTQGKEDKDNNENMAAIKSNIHQFKESKRPLN